MNILLPPIFIFLGIAILLQPKYFWDKYGVYIDLSGMQLIFGPVFIIAGFYWIYRTIHYKKFYKKIGYKCYQCGKVFKLDSLADHKCNSCNLKLEELEGFFERHPEFKEQ